MRARLNLPAAPTTALPRLTASTPAQLDWVLTGRLGLGLGGVDGQSRM
jgi:hypothetical protein